MQTTSMSDFRKEMKKYLDFVTEDHETLIINRGENKAAVVISLDDFNSFTETKYLLSTEANRKHLLDSIEQAKTGQTIDNDLIEE